MKPTKIRSVLKISGLFYFFFNLIIFVALLALCISTSANSLRLSPPWLLLLIPGIGMITGLWIRKRSYGWLKSLTVAASLLSSVIILIVAFFIGPQMEQLKAEKFETPQIHQKHRPNSETVKMFLGLYSGDINIIKEQLAAGVSVNAINETSQTPLHVAQNATIVKLLIQQGANIHATNDLGDTPIFNKEIEIAEILLKAGVDIDSRDAEHNTLFIRYAYAGYLEGLKFLVNQGTNINSCNKEKQNAIDIIEHFHPNSDAMTYLKTLNFQRCR